MQKLISILTPSYNCGHLINRLLDSILRQTYNKIEIFIIDDGSTDNTKQVIEAYSEKFEEKGYAFSYIYQENQGQSSAINNGLKLIHGDYLVWPDADDFYIEPDALEILAAALDMTDDDVGCSRCLGNYIDEERFNIIDKTIYNENEYLFEDCLYAKKGFYYIPILFMIKTYILFNEINERNIYTEKDAGQNWQILLPVLYKHKCITISKYLINILSRADSHSRIPLSFEKQMNRIKTYLNTTIAVLNDIKSINEEKKMSYIAKLKYRFHTLLFQTCIHFGKLEEAKKIYKQTLMREKHLSLKIKLCHILCFIPFGYFIYKIYKKLRK